MNSTRQPVPVRFVAQVAMMLACLVVQAAAAAGSSPSDAARPGVQALDYAFLFASAIESDPRDMCDAQAGVTLDYATLGAFDQAEARADRIECWRRGAVYADLAVALAVAKRSGEARTMVDKARQFGATQTGWQERRIAAHLARALAELGDAVDSEKIAVDLATSDPQQYAGRSLATVTAGQAARGEYEEAMNRLDKLEKQTDLDVTWWRTVGFLSIARQEDLPEAKRRTAREAARKSANGIAGWKKAEALESIAEEFRLSGDPASAREALTVADTIVEPLEPTMPIKAPLLSNLARAWGRLGERDRARVLLGKADETLSSAPIIDRPAILANLASSYQLLGERDQADRTYDRAIGTAEKLENARPRALAAVAVCRSMGQARVVLDETLRARLDGLLAGLKAPW